MHRIRPHNETQKDVDDNDDGGRRKYSSSLQHQRCRSQCPRQEQPPFYGNSYRTGASNRIGSSRTSVDYRHQPLDNHRRYPHHISIRGQCSEWSRAAAVGKQKSDARTPVNNPIRVCVRVFGTETHRQRETAGMSRAIGPCTQHSRCGIQRPPYTNTWPLRQRCARLRRTDPRALAAAISRPPAAHARNKSPTRAGCRTDFLD